MKEETKNVLKDIAKAIITDPVIALCTGLLIGETVMYVAAKADLKNAKKAAKSEAELARAFGKLEGGLEMAEVNVKVREKMELEHEKEVKALKAEIEELKSKNGESIE